MSKLRNKNKQELDSFSGVKPKIVKRLRIKFEFTLPDGSKIKNGQGRLKIGTEGEVHFLTQTENGWKAQKGCKLLYLRITYELPKLLDKSKRGVPRKPARK